MEYGKGYAVGNYYLDTVTVGGIPVVTSLFGVATASNSMASGMICGSQVYMYYLLTLMEASGVYATVLLLLLHTTLF
jgi:hypothetical protein